MRFEQSFRNGLQTYINNPSNSRVLCCNEDFVTIKDAYPKALRHYLVLPRDPDITHLHPLTALSDQNLFDKVITAVDEAKEMMVESLVKEGFLEDCSVKRSSFKNSFIKAGVHSVPSMANLHIHVITQDFYSPSMKHKKHYNSFTTPFFVELGDIQKVNNSSESGPSDVDSSDGSIGSDSLVIGNECLLAMKAQHKPQKPSSSGDKSTIISNTPLTCSYCGKKFGNKFSLLKQHLSEEFALKFGGGGLTIGSESV